MRLGWISSFPPLTDGLAIYSNMLCRALCSKRNDLEIIVIRLARGGHSGFSTDKRIKIYETDRPDSLFFPFKVLRLLYKKVQIIHCQYEYWCFGRGMRAIIFPLLLLFFKVLRMPVVVTIHTIVPPHGINSEFLNRHKVGGFVLVKKVLYSILIKIIASLSSAIIVHLEAQSEVLSQDYNVNQKKIFLIPHGSEGFEVSSISKYEAREILGLPKEQNIILSFGDIRRGKGLEFTINAMKGVLEAYPKTILVIVGQYSPQRSIESEGLLEELKAEINSLNLDEKIIILNKFIKEEYVPTYFQATDIVVLPYTEHEILSASGPLHRAISYGVPVIVSRIRRFSDVVSHLRSVVVVKPSDTRELELGIISLLSDSARRAIMSDELKQISQQYSWTKVAEATLNLYNVLIAVNEQ